MLHNTKSRNKGRFFLLGAVLLGVPRLCKEMCGSSRTHLYLSLTHSGRMVLWSTKPSIKWRSIWVPSRKSIHCTEVIHVCCIVTVMSGICRCATVRWDTARSICPTLIPCMDATDSQGSEGKCPQATDHVSLFMLGQGVALTRRSRKTPMCNQTNFLTPTNPICTSACPPLPGL